MLVWVFLKFSVSFRFTVSTPKQHRHLECDAQNVKRLCRVSTVMMSWRWTASFFPLFKLFSKCLLTSHELKACVRDMRYMFDDIKWFYCAYISLWEHIWAHDEKSRLISVTVKWQNQRNNVDERRKCFNELHSNFFSQFYSFLTLNCARLSMNHFMTNDTA